MKQTMFLTFTLAALLLTACSEQNAPAPTTEVIDKKVFVKGGAYTNVTVSELQRLLRNKDFVLVNVHIPYEGDIPGTDLSIPFNKIENSLAQLLAEKDTKILVYCRGGPMSRMAAKTLVRLGYTHVLNLKGGFDAWKSAGQPLEFHRR